MQNIFLATEQIFSFLVPCGMPNIFIISSYLMM